MRYRVGLIAVMLLICTPQSHANEIGSRWLNAALGLENARSVEQRPELVLKRQDHGRLMMNRSAVGQPLVIGSKTFEHGLGTHSNSEILIKLKPGEVNAFEASVG